MLTSSDIPATDILHKRSVASKERNYNDRDSTAAMMDRSNVLLVSRQVHRIQILSHKHHLSTPLPDMDSADTC